MFKPTQTYRVRGELLVACERDADPATPLAVDCRVVAASPSAAAADAPWIAAHPRGYRAWRWRTDPSVEAVGD